MRFACALAAAMAALCLAPGARADEPKPADAKPAEKPAGKDRASALGKTNLVARASTELSFYQDDDAVTVVTPTIAASVENPVSEWSVSGRYLVDVVSAASADIVATASRRWREVRHEGDLDAGFKVGPVGFDLSGSVSREPDYLAFAGGANASIDLDEKNYVLLVGYAYGHDTIGRSGTPFEVFSRAVQRHTVDAGLTILVNRATILSLLADAAIELGDSSKPYRYIPMFDAATAPSVSIGASIGEVNDKRLPERPIEQLPVERYRFAATARIAHRFTGATLRVFERFYRDTWGLTASSTDAMFIFDAGERVSLWPHARFHLQTPVDFWQRAYVASYAPGGGWTVPALRTGDRELGPLRSLTGGAGIRIKVGPSLSPADWILGLQGDVIWTSFLDDLYLDKRISGLGVLSLEATFE